MTTNALAATVGPPRRDVHQHHPQPARPRTSRASRFDPNDPTVIYAVLGGFNGVGRARAATCSARRSAAPRGPTSRRRSTCRSARSRSTARDTPSTILRRHRSSACCARSTAARPGPCSTTSTSRVRRCTDLVLSRHGGSCARRPTGAASSSSPSRPGPAIAVHLEDDLDFGTVCQGPAVPDAQDLQRRRRGPGDHERAAADGLDRLQRAADARHAAGRRGRARTSTSRSSTPPTVIGVTETATIRISSNDPVAPFVDLPATGMQGRRRW